jgi:hypothetical protein
MERCRESALKKEGFEERDHGLITVVHKLNDNRMATELQRQRVPFHRRPDVDARRFIMILLAESEL